jgi:hypothetical protein
MRTICPTTPKTKYEVAFYTTESRFISRSSTRKTRKLQESWNEFTRINFLPLKSTSCNSSLSHYTRMFYKLYYICNCRYCMIQVLCTLVHIIISRCGTSWRPNTCEDFLLYCNIFCFFFWAMWQSSGIYLPPLYHDFPSQSKNTIWFSKLQTLTNPDSEKLDNLKFHKRMQRKGKESPQSSWIFRIYACDFWADTGVHSPACKSSIG